MLVKFDIGRDFGMTSNVGSKEQAIKELGIIDCGFGLLPIVGTIQTRMNSQEKNYFNINEFLGTTRQFMVLLEAYAGTKHREKFIGIKNITYPDYLIFENSIRFNNLPRDFIENIFSSLKEKYLNSYETAKKRGDAHKIEKKDVTITGSPYIVKELENSLNLPKNNFDGVIHMPNKPISDPEAFVNRIDLTNQLAKLIDDSNLKNMNSSSNSNEEFNNEIQKKFKCILVFPLFGKVREFPDQEVLYLMLYYKTSKNIELSVVSKYLDNLFPEIIQYNSEIRKLIKQSADKCKPAGHQCFISKLLARKRGSDGICVVLFVKFSREVKKSKSSIKQLYDYIKKDLRESDWEAYMNRLDNYQFPI